MYATNYTPKTRTPQHWWSGVSTSATMLTSVTFIVWSTSACTFPAWSHQRQCVQQRWAITLVVFMCAHAVSESYFLTMARCDKHCIRELVLTMVRCDKCCIKELVPDNGEVWQMLYQRASTDNGEVWQTLYQRASSWQWWGVTNAVSES